MGGGGGGRLSPAQAPASAPFTQGLLKSALSLAVFPELEGLQLCSTVHVILEQTELALGEHAPLQMKPAVWWEEHGARNLAHPGLASSCSVTLSKSPHPSRLRLLCPRLLPALKVSHYTSGGSCPRLRLLGPINFFIWRFPPTHTHTHCSYKLLSVYKMSFRLFCICINAFPFSKSCDDLVFCNCIWPLSSRESPGQGDGVMGRAGVAKVGSRGLNHHQVPGCLPRSSWLSLLRNRAR